MNKNGKWLVSGVITVAVVAAGFAVNRNDGKLKEDSPHGGAVDVAESVAGTPESQNRVSLPEPAEVVPQVELSEVLAVAAESTRMRAAGRPMKTAEEQARERRLAEQISQLTPRQLDEFIETVVGSAELTNSEKTWWLMLGLKAMSSTDVERSLDLLVTHSGFLQANKVAEGCLATVIGNLASRDVVTADARLDTFLKAHPEFTGKGAVQVIIQKAGTTDVPLAFQLLRKNVTLLGDKETKSIIKHLADGRSSPEATLVILQEVRNWPELKEGEGEYGSPQIWAVRNAASAVMAKGFDSSAEWFKQAKLDGEETRAFAMAIDHGDAGDDTGKWLNWMGENAPRLSFPEEKREEWWQQIRSVIEDWVEDSPKKVSGWLETQPPGEVRDGAIVGYARTIQEDHPDAAADWVKLLSQEKDQQTMLNQIYQEASFDSSEEAKAFIAKHGIRLKEEE